MTKEFQILPKEIIDDISQNIRAYSIIDIVVYTYQNKDYQYPTTRYFNRLNKYLDKAEIEMYPKLSISIEEMIEMYQKYYGGSGYLIAREQKVINVIINHIQKIINEINSNITEDIDAEKISGGSTETNITQ